ncbi:MAG: serine/threonine-protein kinase [Polyangiaceae bacterium]
MTQPPPLTIGGKYRVARRLGQGGMGSVYEAVDDAGARVAIKVIQTELAHNQTLVGRFAREARAVSAIDTPHITKSIDTGTDPLTGLPYLVMELLDGEDVDQLGQRLGPLPSDLALRIAAQACKALQKAHEAHILHRDIKPANLFLTRTGGHRITKLLDFGVAKVKPEVTRSNAETAGLTRTGSMLGSPLYMSPEQARGYKDIDYRSDLWSLGVVLYKMLSGRTPHDDTEELGELIVLICTEPPQPIQDLAPWVAPEVAAVVHRALRFSPGERYASAADMLHAINALIRGDLTIHEGYLRPLSEAEKAYVAPRLQADLTDAPPPRKGVITTGSGTQQLPNVPPPTPSYSGGQPGYPPQSTLSAGAVGSGTGPGSYGGQGVSQPARSPAPWIAAAALGALLLAGLVGAQILGVFKPTAAALPTATASATADKPRSVTVVILPPNATVEVEGVPTKLTEGLLEIEGAVGSVHKVRVVSGSVEKTVRVVVAESGAVPPKIELDVPAVTPTSTATATTPPLGGVKPKPKPTAAPSTDPLRDQR